ncbi:MAG: sugar nucleotide-binding protein [Candidatus Dependentiae bacterium]
MKKIVLTLFISTIILSHTMFAKTVLLFGGKTGWIGQQLIPIFSNSGYQVHCAESRLENRTDIINEIKKINPDVIVSAAGLTGTPNVDWCEDHKQETLRTNVIGTLNLADICATLDIHLTNLGTGCIYEYDADHNLENLKGYTEEDTPNFSGSFYSKTKAMVDGLLLNYPNVLNLRIRMPISDDLHPKNFITKITRYQKVINIPNSMSVLTDLLPLIPQMIERKLTGNYNFTNPGVISHNQILDLYKKYIDPSFTYENFTLNEQAQILKAKRSNNCLDCSKLLKEFPHIPSIQESIVNVFKRMTQSIKGNQQE